MEQCQRALEGGWGPGRPYVTRLVPHMPGTNCKVALAFSEEAKWPGIILRGTPVLSAHWGLEHPGHQLLGSGSAGLPSAGLLPFLRLGG